MARKVAEMQFQKRLEREQQKELLKRAKQMKSKMIRFSCNNFYYSNIL